MLNFELIGTLKTKSASEIVSSPWSFGGETQDRDFTVYAHYKKYVGPLGAKAIRLQAGWAKCERTKGQYNWTWLDEVVDDALAQGVEPWLELSYGNPVYPGGGGATLGAGLPHSPEALVAWDAWVKAIVERFKNRLHTWEVWNEPDLKNHMAPEAYAEFYLRTAAIVRAQDPKAKIIAGAFSKTTNTAFAEALLKLAQKRDQLSLIDIITVHGYPANPDDTKGVDVMRKLAAQYSPNIEIRQGETGAPSGSTLGALRDLTWSPVTQAKWDLRRALAHHGKDVPFSLYTICDQNYEQDGVKGLNRKGLLETDGQTHVTAPKPAYYAAQRVFTIFDSSLLRVKKLQANTKANNIAIFGYNKKEGSLLTIWNKHERPVDDNTTTPVDITVQSLPFTDPVYADLLTGKVYALPRDRWTQDGTAIKFHDIPVYDSPILIADKSLLLINPATKE